MTTHVIRSLLVCVSFVPLLQTAATCVTFRLTPLPRDFSQARRVCSHPKACCASTVRSWSTVRTPPSRMLLSTRGFDLRMRPGVSAVRQQSPVWPTQSMAWSLWRVRLCPPIISCLFSAGRRETRRPRARARRRAARPTRRVRCGGRLATAPVISPTTALADFIFKSNDFLRRFRDMYRVP